MFAPEWLACSVVLLLGIESLCEAKFDVAVGDRRVLVTTTLIVAHMVVSLVLWAVTPDVRHAAVFHAALACSLSSLQWVVTLPLDIIPWHLVVSCTICALSLSGRESMASWLAVGESQGVLFCSSVLLSAVTAGALVAWKLVLKKSSPLESVLGPMLSPKTLLLFAFLNALQEEVEFRGIFMTAMGLPMVGLPLHVNDVSMWTILVWVLQAAVFAAQHVLAGFPSGTLGFIMVWCWGLALGMLRSASQGLFLVYGVHVIADFTIGLLVMATHPTPMSMTNSQMKRPRQLPKTSIAQKRASSSATQVVQKSTMVLRSQSKLRRSNPHGM